MRKSAWKRALLLFSSTLVWNEYTQQEFQLGFPDSVFCVDSHFSLIKNVKTKQRINFSKIQIDGQRTEKYFHVSNKIFSQNHQKKKVTISQCIMIKTNNAISNSAGRTKDFLKNQIHSCTFFTTLMANANYSVGWP